MSHVGSPAAQGGEAPSREGEDDDRNRPREDQEVGGMWSLSWSCSYISKSQCLGSGTGAQKADEENEPQDEADESPCGLAGATDCN